MNWKSVTCSLANSEDHNGGVLSAAASIKEALSYFICWQDDRISDSLKEGLPIKKAR